MIVGEIRSQIDSIWNDFWSGGIASMLNAMVQTSHFLVRRRLDGLQFNRQEFERSLSAAKVDPS